MKRTAAAAAEEVVEALAGEENGSYGGNGKNEKSVKSKWTLWLSGGI